MTDSNETTPNQENDQNNNGTPPEPKWWLDEKTPGHGERPEWLGDKFKSAADLAKSYAELEKRFGTAPEKYDFSKSKYLDGEYAPFQEFQELAKSKQVPQEVVDKMIDSVDRYFSEFSTDMSEEIKSLGENAKERLTVLNNWAKANLSEDAYYALTSSLRTADSIKAMEQLRNKMMSSNTQVPGNDGSSNTVATMEELQSELNKNLDKYKTDVKYRSDIQARIAAATAAGHNRGFVDKNA